MPLGNWVMLEQNIPERMHFIGHTVEVRTITERQTGQPAARNVLVLEVDRVNGVPATAKFSTMAEGLYKQLEPFLVGKLYLNYEFIITQMGTGFMTKYRVDRFPYVAPAAPG